MLFSPFSSWMLFVKWKEGLSRGLPRRFLTHRTHFGPGLHRRNCGRQFSHAHQIGGGAGESEGPRHFAHSAMPHFAPPGHRLQPAETFFDALPFLLADGVSRVPRGARINGAAARSRMVL